MCLIDFSTKKVSAVELANHMKACFINTGDVRTSDYYCGITNDIQANKTRHNVDDYVVVCKCPNASIAAEVETLLGDRDGFDIGKRGEGNGGTDDSVYVYMYKKTKNTQE